MDGFSMLMRQFVAATNGGQPLIASDSWVYGRLNGGVPKPRLQADGSQVCRRAARTSPRDLKRLGPIAPETSMFSATTRVPSNHFWPKSGDSREEWRCVPGRAVLLHDDAKAPWE